MKETEIQWKHVLYLGLLALAFIIPLMLFVAKPEAQNIKAETQRLNEIEQKAVIAIAQEDTTMALAYILQLNWQYNPRNAGGIQTASKNTENWNLKRRNYLIAIGKDPDKYMFSNENNTFKLKGVDRYKEH
jgi:hypothetical protein